MKIHKKFVVENYVPISELRPAPNFIGLSDVAKLAIREFLVKDLKLEKYSISTGFFGGSELPVLGLPDGLHNGAEIFSIRGEISGMPTLKALIKVAEEDFGGPLPQPPKESFTTAEKAILELGLIPPPFQTLEIIAAYDDKLSKLEQMFGNNEILKSANSFVNDAPNIYIEFMNDFRRNRKDSVKPSLREINPDIYAKEIDSVGEEAFFGTFMPAVSEITHEAAQCVVSELSRQKLKQNMEIVCLLENLRQVPKQGDYVKIAEYGIRERGLFPFVAISGAFDRTGDRKFTSKSRVHLNATSGGDVHDAVFEALDLFRSYLVNKGSRFWDFMLGDKKEVRGVELNTDLSGLAKSGDVNAFVESYARKWNFRIN